MKLNMILLESFAMRKDLSTEKKSVKLYFEVNLMVYFQPGE